MLRRVRCNSTSNSSINGKAKANQSSSSLNRTQNKTTKAPKSVIIHKVTENRKKVLCGARIIEEINTIIIKSLSVNDRIARLIFRLLSTFEKFYKLFKLIFISSLISRWNKQPIDNQAPNITGMIDSQNILIILLIIVNLIVMDEEHLQRQTLKIQYQC